MPNSDDAVEEAGTVLPPSLRLLKVLVIALMLSLIAGVLAVVWLLVTQAPRLLAPAAPPAPVPHVPDTLALPAGESPAAITFGKGWTAVVTESGRILIFDATNTLVQETGITP